MSQVAIRELEVALGSFEAQLASLYADREATGGASVADLTDALASFEAQLASLYADREDAGDASATIEGLNAQLAALYDEKSEQGDLQGILEGLEAQLHALYREREDGDFAAAAGGAESGALIATIRSFEEQLASFYEAQSQNAYGLAEANAMVQSLEPQVAALLEERNELAAALHAKELELERSRTKAKDMVSALMERALA
jgi:chromosome segregation ATPase